MTQQARRPDDGQGGQGHAWVRVCRADTLVNGARGAGADLPPRPGAGTTVVVERAFVIRHGDVLRAYVNRCAHVPVPLDWMPEQFFDADGRFLICAVHGALYEPASGRCAGGPCRGRGHLEPLELREDAQGWVHVRRADRGAP